LHQQSNADSNVAGVLINPVVINITRVTPAQPEENQPIQVDYTISNFMPGKTLNGEVTLQVPQGEAKAVQGLSYRASQSGTLRGLAPLAGQNIEIKVAYQEFGGVAEFVPTFEADDSDFINISARYELRIDWVKVDNPRAPIHDTLVGECTATYGGQPVPNQAPQRTPFDTPSPTVAEAFGNHGAGDVIWTPTFTFGPISGVPGLAPDLVFNYSFANKGYDQSHEADMLTVLDWISKLGAAIASAALPAYSGLSPIVEQFNEFINSLFFTNCDGLVAGDSFTVQSAKLAAVTGGDQHVFSTDPPLKYQGTSSPVMCGETSNYEVHWTIRRLSRDLEGHLAP
jgi:hypothetical protein